MSQTLEKYELAADKSLVLFDGDCLLCSHSVRFIFERDSGKRFLFAPLQSSVGRQFLEEHGLPIDELNTMVLIDGGEAHQQSDAALRIAGRLSFPWNWLSMFRVLPRLIRDRLYRLVAANRYRWFGKSEACEIPPAELRDRILS